MQLLLISKLYQVIFFRITWDGNGEKKYAVICVFDNASWKPVYWGKIKNGQIVFRRMMGDVCYMAGCYNQGKIVPANEPFILKKDGGVEYLKINKNVCLSMTLKRKYPRFPRMELFATHIRRGKVRGADNRQFQSSTLLFDIMGTPSDIVDSLVNVKQRFRYLQIEPAIYRTGDLAEIEFYGKKNLNEPEQKLVGQVFGFSEVPINNGHPYLHAMDGDYETYYSKGKEERIFTYENGEQVWW